MHFVEGFNHTFRLVSIFDYLGNGCAILYCCSNMIDGVVSGTDPKNPLRSRGASRKHRWTLVRLPN